MEELRIYEALAAVGYRPTLVGYTGVDEGDCAAFSDLPRKIVVLHGMYRMDVSALPQSGIETFPHELTESQIAEAGIERVRWSELDPAPRGAKWFPVIDADGQEGVNGPPEGGLDRASWDRLFAALVAASREGRDTECLAVWASANAAMVWPAQPAGQEAFAVRGRLSEIADKRYPHPEIDPSSWWPADLSWFVSSDLDALHTEVVCDDDLAQLLLADDFLETWEVPRDWTPASAR